MTTKQLTEDEVLALADASNELCAAIEIFRIDRSDSIKDFSWNLLIQRKDSVWNLLEKFGY